MGEQHVQQFDLNSTAIAQTAFNAKHQHPTAIPFKPTSMRVAQAANPAKVRTANNILDWICRSRWFEFTRSPSQAGSHSSAILLPYSGYTQQQKQQAILIWKMIKEGLSAIRCSAIPRASCGQLRYSSARGTVYEASRRRLLEKLKSNVRTFSKLVSRQRNSVRQSSKRQTMTRRNSEPMSHRTLKLQGSPCHTLSIVKDHGNVDHFFLKVSLLRNQPRPPSSTHQLKHLLQKKPVRLLGFRSAQNSAAPKGCSKETPYRSIENSLMVLQENHLRRASLQTKPPEVVLTDSTISPWGISSDRE